MLRTIDARSRAGAKELERLLGARRASPDFATLRRVTPVVEAVLRKGPKALARYVRLFDGVTLSSKGLLVDPARGPLPKVDPGFARAFRLAVRRVAAYHRRQRSPGFSFRDSLGVRFAERPFPLDSVGVYVPGGRAFYPSSLLMGVVPARVAGVPRIVVATPPRAYAGSAELRWALRELGVREVLLAGGAHGVAGLVSVARVAKVVGPGNRFVAAAKHLVSSVVAVDLPAGPSEVLIVASADASAGDVAADLLAQAEHDPDAVCLLFTTSARLVRKVLREVERQLAGLPTARTARRSLARNGRAVVFGSLADAVAAGLRVAAEHVQVMGKAAAKDGERLLPTAGALFLGSSTPTAFGDYVAGPNHVLPTGGAARSFSGLSLRDFVRWGRLVEMDARAAGRLAKSAAALARFEGLAAHERSAARRRR
jgi:histidinol dehydrogenase